MFKVSTAVVGFLFSIILLFRYFIHAYVGLVYYEFIVRFFIIFSLFFGLLVATYLNKKNIKTHFYKRRSYDLRRCFYKFFTFILIYFSSIAFSFLMVDIFKNELYSAYFNDSVIFSPVVFCIFFIWVVYLDQRQENPEDEYYRFSNDLVYKNKKLKIYKTFLLASLVKVFYIPFMYGAAITAIYQVLIMDNIIKNPAIFLTYLFFLGLSFDVVSAFGGYLFSSKFFSTETISVDETWVGWLVCLICYPPFLIIYRFFTKQVDDYIWTDWVAPDQFLYWLWALLICMAWIFYWFSTMSFGFRFSNLSWRGLVNNGLYRYIKHPAYLSKNIYWWLHTVPFFGVFGLDLYKNLLALSCVSLIYYLRAKTEERHLMNFVEYREYSHWISENGLWAKIRLKLGF